MTATATAEAEQVLEQLEVPPEHLDRAFDLIRPGLGEVLKFSQGRITEPYVRWAAGEGFLTLVLLTHGGDYAGFHVLQPLTEEPGEEKWLSHAHVWIEPSFRRRGIYREVMAWTEEWARSRGFAGIELMTPAGDGEDHWPAVLKSVGFEPWMVRYKKEL